MSRSRLLDIAEALASIRDLTVAECERAFHCKLSRDANDRRQYWGSCPELDLAELDVRIGKTGGIVFVTLDRAVQEALAKELRVFGEPDDVEMESACDPPDAETQQSRWSVGHFVLRSMIYFSLEEVDGSKRLVGASRQFRLSLKNRWTDAFFE